MEVTTTSHTKPCAHFEGYLYVVKRRNVDGTVVWRCSKQQSTKYRGIFKTKVSNILASNKHRCGTQNDSRLSKEEIARGRYFDP